MDPQGEQRPPALPTPPAGAPAPAPSPAPPPPLAPAFPGAQLLPQAPFAHVKPFSIGRIATLIGSGLEAQIRLRSRTVSRRHALILNVDGRIVLADLASRGGTLVNGRPASRRTLRDGDRISIGKIECVLLAGPPSDLSPPAIPPPARLSFGPGRSTPLAAPMCIIGREKHCDVVIPDPEVARSHAVIFAAGGQWLLGHLPARSVTLVNGQPASLLCLNDGDEIDVVGRRIRFAVASGHLPAPTAAPDEGRPVPPPPRTVEASRSLDTDDIDDTDDTDDTHEAIPDWVADMGPIAIAVAARPTDAGNLLPPPPAPPTAPRRWPWLLAAAVVLATGAAIALLR